MNLCRWLPAWRSPVWASAFFACLAGVCQAADPAKRVPNEIINSIGMKLVLIPSGEFMMGSRESAEALVAAFAEIRGNPQRAAQAAAFADAFRDEQPYHRVRITRAFYLGVHEVTQGQYERVRGTNPSHFAGDPSCPVEMVTWDDAVEFCKKLSELEGAEYRLPTEAEWEYACRARSTTRYYFGDDPRALGQYAWTGEGWTAAKKSEYKPRPGGQKAPNLWRLYDMLGNVQEWCADWYGADYYANSPLEDPTGPPSGTFHVRRGGSWDISIPYYLRSSYRSIVEVGGAYNIGFRVARIAGDSPQAPAAASHPQAGATPPAVLESPPRPAGDEAAPATTSGAEAPKGIGQDPPRTASCRFQVFGLNHKEMGRMNEELARRDPKFKRFVFTVYGHCDECWEKILAEEGCRELRIHYSGGRTGEHDNHPDRYQPRLVPWDVSTYASFPLDTDLAPIAKAIVAPRPPHRAAKSFYAVLYAELKANQVKAAQKALAGLPGVDSRESKVDVPAGRIHVRITGQKSIRMRDLVAAFQEAGVPVTTSRGAGI